MEKVYIKAILVTEFEGLTSFGMRELGCCLFS